MSQNQDPMAQIAELIENKSNIKQHTYRQLCETFKQLKQEAKSVVERINAQIKNKDKDISVKVINVNDREFHVKMAGDLLVFLMHTNIVTLDEKHGFNKSDYVAENPIRKYLGQINIYNFMADSVTYNRLNDPGYLVARFSLNFEKRFLVEGKRRLNFMFDTVSGAPVTNTDLSIIIQLALAQTIETDLVTRPFPEIQRITLNEKVMRTQAMGGGYKIGFQMNENQKVE
ncbi:hypothetical protein E1176_04130 [Fulvivirga sp. RKSG066]|uniref:hypothetical protein n=1 Tax=Fulvivirga aurantia TaxID=2529383 RepID=UPI0012BC41DD|nr:hypothetical protein [Fulvivirga aurantia]MTI20199.1 hypothetical protein [Fulvivirga aurantia]